MREFLKWSIAGEGLSSPFCGLVIGVSFVMMDFPPKDIWSYFILACGISLLLCFVVRVFLYRHSRMHICKY